MRTYLLLLCCLASTTGFGQPTYSFNFARSVDSVNKNEKKRIHPCVGYPVVDPFQQCIKRLQSYNCTRS